MYEKENHQIFFSKTLIQGFSDIDSKIFDLEQENVELKKKVKVFEDEKNKNLFERFNESQRQTAQTLSAIIGSSTIDSLTPATAVILNKIKHMNSIDEIKKYIDSIFGTKKVKKSTKKKK